MQNKMNSFIFYAEVQPIFAFLSKDSANRTNLLKNAGITSKNRRNDAKCLNINIITVTNNDKTEKRKTQ